MDTSNWGKITVLGRLGSFIIADLINFESSKSLE